MLIADTFGVSLEWLVRRAGQDPISSEDLDRSCKLSPADNGDLDKAADNQKTGTYKILGVEYDDELGHVHEMRAVPTKFDDLLRLLYALTDEEIDRARTILFAAFAEKVAILAKRNGKTSNSGRDAVT